MSLKTAERKQVKLKLGLSGAAGSGKTATALILAYGMCGDWNKIALIDTENESGSLYADHELPNGFRIGKFQTDPLQPPFTPEKYIASINECQKAGIQVVIIDSITSEWAGKGGCLDIHEEETKKMKTPNSYMAWAKVTPRHNDFIEAILQSPMHIITCVRAKDDYVLSDKNGKQVPEKVGMASITRSGYDFELTISFDLTQDHRAIATKDRTGLFQDKPHEIITVETGKRIIAWCESGAEPTKTIGLPEAIKAINKSVSMAEVQILWTKYASFQKEPEFKKAKDEMKVKLTPA